MDGHRCDRCTAPVPLDRDLHDACARCHKDLCAVCLAEGCCGVAPAASSDAAVAAWTREGWLYTSDRQIECWTTTASGARWMFTTTRFEDEDAFRRATKTVRRDPEKLYELTRVAAERGEALGEGTVERAATLGDLPVLRMRSFDVWNATVQALVDGK